MTSTKTVMNVYQWYFYLVEKYRGLRKNLQKYAREESAVAGY